MSKDKRRSRPDYDMTDEERRLKKFEPYRKVRKPIPPPSRFFKDKRHKRVKTIESCMVGEQPECEDISVEDTELYFVGEEPSECEETDGSQH